MISRIKNQFYTQFIKQPVNIIFVIVLTVSVFLPLFITIPVILATFVFIIINKERRNTFLHSPYISLFAALAILTLVTPLFFKNYYGFACGILMLIFFVLEVYINSIMTQNLYDLLCGICCAMSMVCAFAAVVEKLLNFQTRAMAFTYNANFYGYLIEITILICFYKIITTKKKMYWGIIAVNVGALFLSDCRSAWTGILGGLLVMFIILKMKKSLIALWSTTAAVAAAIYLDNSLFPRIGDFGSTVSDRSRIWGTALNDFLKHPVFGRGFLAMYQVTGNVITPHAHNILFDLLECTGIIGTSIVIFLFIMVIRQFAGAFKLGNGKIKACVALCAGVIAATITHGITDMPIMGIHTGLFFFIILSLRPRPDCITESETENNPEFIQINEPAKAVKQDVNRIKS